MPTLTRAAAWQVFQQARAAYEAARRIYDACPCPAHASAELTAAVAESLAEAAYDATPREEDHSCTGPRDS